MSKIIHIDLGGTPPVGFEGHPEDVLRRLGMRVIEWRACTIGDYVEAKVDKVADALPEHMKVVDEWSIPDYRKEFEEKYE